MLWTCKNDLPNGQISIGGVQYWIDYSANKQQEESEDTCTDKNMTLINFDDVIRIAVNISDDIEDLFLTKLNSGYWLTHKSGNKCSIIKAGAVSSAYFSNIHYAQCDSLYKTLCRTECKMN